MTNKERKTSEGLPIADKQWLARLMQYDPNWPEKRDLFFSMALEGYYDAMWDGLDRETGHIIYRLSDMVDLEDRKSFAIYPDQGGSLLDQDGINPWDSLEDWRKKWAKAHNDIPDYTVVNNFIRDYIHKPSQNS